MTKIPQLSLEVMNSISCAQRDISGILMTRRNTGYGVYYFAFEYGELFGVEREIEIALKQHNGPIIKLLQSDSKYKQDQFLRIIKNNTPILNTQNLTLVEEHEYRITYKLKPSDYITIDTTKLHISTWIGGREVRLDIMGDQKYFNECVEPLRTKLNKEATMKLGFIKFEQQFDRNG